MLSYDITTIVFKVINFAILIAAVIYLFKRYALSVIKAQITQQYDDHKLLQQKSHHAIAKQEEVERAIVYQKELYQKLHQKIEQWNDIFAVVVKEREREKETIKIALHHKALQQQNYIASSYVTQIVLPAALDNARHQLIADFNNNSQEAITFNETLIAYMKKSVS